jgi:hypothetical protein
MIVASRVEHEALVPQALLPVQARRTRPLLSRGLVDHGVATVVAIPAAVVQPDQYCWVCPYLQVPRCAVRQQVRVHFLPNGYTSGTLVLWATLTAVRVKAYELLLLPTMQANILPPSLSHGRVLRRKHEGLPLGNVIDLHVSVLVNDVHLPDSAILDCNVSVPSWRHDGGRSRIMQLPTVRFFPYKVHLRDAFSVSADRCVRDETGPPTDGEEHTVFGASVTCPPCSRDTWAEWPNKVSIHPERREQPRHLCRRHVRDDATITDVQDNDWRGDTHASWLRKADCHRNRKPLFVI